MDDHRPEARPGVALRFRSLDWSQLRRGARTVRRRLGLPGSGAPSVEVARRLAAATTNAERAVARQEHVHQHLDDGTLTMGAQSYFAPTVYKFKGDHNRVVIGSFCSVAADASFYVGGIHPLAWVSQYGLREMFALPGAFEPPMPSSNGDIVVGHDCWITDASTILSGITIGNGAVVGTRAVVTKDVAPYTIVAGNPARVVGRRFSEEQAAALERIAWWDWDLDTVLARVDDLNRVTVDEFIARYDPG